MLRKISFTNYILIAVVCFFLFGYILNPTINLVALSLKNTASFDAFLLKKITKSATNSILLSLISVAGSSIIGIFFAYTYHYKNIKFKSFFSNLLLLPLAIPPMVGVMSYLFLLDDNGFLMHVFGKGSFSFSGWTAIAVVHIYSFYPLSYLFVGNNLRRIDSAVVEASFSLGASKSKTFWSIIFPQLMPSIVSSSMLIFMASMASFSAPFIFSGTDTFLSTEIYYAKINGNMPLAAFLSVVLVGISVLFFLTFRWYSNRNPLTINSKGTQKRNAITSYSKYDYGSTILSLFFGILIVLPIISLVLISVLPENSLFFNSNPFSFTGINYKAVFSDTSLMQPLLNSVTTSLMAVAFTFLFSLVIAHFIRGKQNVFQSILETFVTLPYSIPGTVIAICMILSFNHPSVFSFYSVLVSTFWILPIVYTIRNLPFLVQTIKSSLSAIDKSIEEAATALGAGSLITWKTITFPLIYGAVLEGTLLVFINSFGEFVATILLYNYDTKTIPIEIYSQIRMNNNGLAATYGVILFLIILSIIAFIRKIKRKYSY